MPTFNLITEGWLACNHIDGQAKRWGLRDILANAHRIRELAEPSPLAQFGGYRLLIALVHWLRPIQTVAQWQGLWHAARFPELLMDELHERGRGRFDLFDEVRPFYQHPHEAKGSKPMTVAYLALEMPTGTSINHFCHVRDGEHAFCPPCCAKGLLALSAFATQGGAGKPMSINGAPPVYALPCGDNLFQTLLLNLPILELTHVWGPRVDGDLPAWARRGKPPRPSIDRPVGLLEGLTWQPRRTHLLPLEDPARCTCCGEHTSIVVRSMRFPRGGDSRGPRDNARPWTDAHVPLEKADANPLRPRAAPQFSCQQWQALLPTEEASDGQPPAVLQQAAVLARTGALADLRSIVVGQIALHAQKGRLVRWLRARFTLPIAVIADDEACAVLRTEIDMLEPLPQQLVRGVPWKEAPEALWGFYSQASGACQRAVMHMGTDTQTEALSRLRAEVRAAALATARRLRVKRPVRDRWRRCAFRASLGRRLDNFVAKGENP